MKKVLFLFGILFLMTACEKQVIQKPENLIPEDKMVNILTDVAVYQAVDGYDPQRFSTNNVKLDEFILNKYGVTAKVIEESNKYYASDVEGYKKLYAKVIAQLEEQKKAAGIEIEKTTGLKPNDNQ